MAEHARVTDQAAGLRRLLRPAALRILPVAGGTLRTGVVVNLAAAAAREGYCVVVLDQSRGEVARAMGLKPRYELLHLIEGEMQFPDVALEAADGVRVLSGARGMAALVEQGGSAQALFSAFMQLERPADLVIVNIEDTAVAGALIPATEGEVLLVATPESDAITVAYSHIKQLAKHSDLTRYRLFVGDAPDAIEAGRIARNMSEVARQFLSARLDYGGVIPRDPQLRQAERARASVIASFPQSPSARAYRRIAAGIPGWNTFEIRGTRPGVIQGHAAH